MIGGGLKIFERSLSLFSDGQITAEASTGAVNRCLDRNRVTYWRSSGSDDTTTETITITWASAISFDRVLLVDHNFKGFNIKYDSGGSFVHFASVVGLDGSQTNITETTFADDTAYYEVPTTTTTRLQIEVTTTQTVDAEKYLNQVLVTNELGTLAGYPDVSGIEFSRNERSKKMLSGKVLTLKGDETFKCSLVFKNYPATLGADIDLMLNLFDLEQTFLVWLCGGRRGSTYFRKALKGWRLKDIFSMQTSGAITPDYRDNVYINPVNLKINLVEAVD